MHLVIFGGSGRTGLELIRQSLQSGYTVTAFVRKQSKLAHLQHTNLTTVEGDLANLAQVRAAISGKDVVISALGVSKTLHHDPVVVEGIATIAKAMELEGISRCIYISVFLAYHKPKQFSFFTSKILKRIICNEISDHEVKEQLIQERVKDYIIVRPAALTNKALTQSYQHAENLVLKTFLPSISRANLAHFIVQQLKKPLYNNQAVVIAENQAYNQSSSSS